jgi:hypothetical protein
MNAKLLLVILSILLPIISYGQVNYSYTDPCTGVTKTLVVPSNGITVTYYGQVNTFQPGDFYSGTFENWAQGVYGSFGGNNPCATVIGLPTGINIAQGTTLNFLSIINSLDAVKDLAGGSTNILSGVDNASRATNGKKEGKKNGNSSNNSGSNGTGGVNTSGQSNSGNASQGQGQVGSQDPGSGSSTNPSGEQGQQGSNPAGGSESNGGQGQQGSNPPGSSNGSGSNGGSNGSGGSGSNGGSNGSGGSGSNGGSNGSGSTTEDPKTEESGGGKTNIIGSTTNNVQSASNKNGNRPNVIASSDFVGFNFKNSDVDYGGKFTGGYTSARWDGARAHGVLVDYTTALRGPNISGFYAFIRKRRIDLISTSLTIGFDRKPTVYGTLALGQMWDLDKKKKIKALYMLTASAGSVYGEPFVGTAAIAGAMYDLKIGKRLDIKLMGLYVYAPYVSYYNDILLKSPHVVLPIIGTNIGITKKFKININGGGAWAIQENALNYTVMMGTRFLL